MLSQGSWADVIAEGGNDRLVGEVKGYTAGNTGLDMDTMFGQLLRRMKPGAATTWAVMVPTHSLSAVLRVPIEVRRALGIRGPATPSPRSADPRATPSDAGPPDRPRTG